MKVRRNALVSRNEFVKPKKENKFDSKIKNIKETIDFLGKVNLEITFNQVVLIMIISSLVGVATGLIFSNLVASIILAIFIPVLEIEILNYIKKDISDYIENRIIKSANLIKNSYAYSYDIKKAIKENIKRTETPLKQLYEEFVDEIEVYHFSVKDSLKRMEMKLKSTTLSLFIEQLILCEEDSSNINSLIATVQQFDDRRRFLDTWKGIKKDILVKNAFIMGAINFVMFQAYGLVKEQMATPEFFNSMATKIVASIYILINLIYVFVVMKTVNKEFE